VNFSQKLLLLASSVALTSGVAQAQNNTIFFEFESSTVANYRQGPTGTAFEGATFGMNVRDGNFFYTFPCDFPFFTFIGGTCAPGTTGWVSRGIENDPLLRGLGPYFTVADIAPAVLLAPFNPAGVRLVAAPPSLLPRPLIGFEDRSLSAFFDLTTNFIRQYTISGYNFGREYAAGERARFDGEVVPGTYRYNFPSIRNTSTLTAPPVVLEVNQFPMLDGYRKVNNQPQGLRFTNVTYDDGFAVLDPFALNTLRWEGNTSNFIAPGIDVAYLSIKRLTDPSDPLSDPDLGAVPLFPSFSGAFEARVLLPSALEKSFILPPNFVLPGETGVIDLEFVIFRPTSSLIFETSTRRFRMPVKVTDPFDGFIVAALPPGATTAQKAASFDYDSDGISNFDEWVFRSDPAKSNSIPISPSVSIKPTTIPGGPSTGLFSVQNTLDTASQGAMEYKVPKITNPVPKLRYAIEYSADMVTWTTITAGNPDWTLVETRTEIKVTASGVNPKTGGFFRTKVQTVN
jgi:hypothetical protein